MIGKISIGKSFYGCISYCLEDKKPGPDDILPAHKNRAEVLYYHQCFGDKYELSEQFSDVRRLNRKVEKPVLHVSFRLREGERLSYGQWQETVEECARALGFSASQYVAILHHDKGDPHLHLVANRVGYDGKVASSRGNYAKVASLCRRLEKRFGLAPVPGSRLSADSNVHRKKVREQVAACLHHCRNMEAFIQAMNAMGTQVMKGRGISFLDDKKVRIKGSEIGFPLAGIERMLDLNESRKAIVRPLSGSEDGRISHGKKQAAPADTKLSEVAGWAIDLLFSGRETYDPGVNEFQFPRKKKKKKRRPNL